jgi:hypothetical protein
MGSRIDKFVRKRKSVKADRATELGIAGHQAAMKAIGFASGGWGNEPEKYSYPYAGETADSADGSQDVVTPGKGHVNIPEIGNGAPYSGDGWAGIEGISNMEYKVVNLGNPGPQRILKRPRKGNE